MPSGLARTRVFTASMPSELAGTSIGTSVSLEGVSPLTSGVSYTAWVVGHNSVGDGPESNHVTFVA